MLGLDCRRAARLRATEEATPAQAEWLARHESACARCAEAAEGMQMALAGLRAAALDPEPSEGFDDRLAMRFELYRRSRTLRFWAPAIVGAALAGVAALAIVELLSTAPEHRQPVLDGHEAKRVELPAIPVGGSGVTR